MAEFHFIDDPNTLELINTIISLAGPNFAPPYDSSGQPTDATERNEEIKSDIMGTEVKGMANPSFLPNMGMVISSLLSILSPFIAAYGMILPILGILKAILEVLCCLMNPFCVIPAVERLLKKWVPALISLFPPIAGMSFLMMIMKMILAIMYFIMTELIPTIQLLITNMLEGIKAIETGDLTKSTAIQQKVEALIRDLINRLGIINIAKPLVDLVFTILRLFAGFPCQDDGVSSLGLLHFDAAAFPFPPGLDTNCCGDDMCPPILLNPPTGTGLLIPKVYGDTPPLWSWQLIPITGGENISSLIPYMQNLSSQLNPQLDEPINEAVPAGYTHDSAHFRLRIAGNRGPVQCGIDVPEQDGTILVPIANINLDNTLIVTNVALSPFQGVINYCIEPNYNQLVARSIMGIGCHPDIIAAKDEVSGRFNLGPSFLDRNPDMAEIQTRFADFNPDACLRELEDLVAANGISQEAVDLAQKCQDDIVSDALDFADFVIGKFNELLVADSLASSLDVDKNVVGAGVTDKAVVSVVPRDVGGTRIAKNLPTGVDIDVDILTDFGILQNQKLNSNTGAVTAELLSPLAGTATVTAKINGEFVTELVAGEEVLEVETVKFVSDAVLPKRRTVSKPSGSTKVRTGSGTEKDRGNR